MSGSYQRPTAINEVMEATMATRRKTPERLPRHRWHGDSLIDHAAIDAIVTAVQW